MNAGPAYESHFGLTDRRLPIIFKPYSVAVGSDSDLVHWHEGIEMFFVTGGSGSILCDSQLLPVAAGDIVVINSNQIHRAMAGREDLVYEYLIIEPELFALVDLEPEGLHFKNVVGSDSHLWTCLHRLVEGRGRENAYGWISQEGLVLQLIGCLMEDFLLPETSGTDQEQNRIKPIKRTLAYIQSHYKEPLDVDMLCEYTGFSKYYFCRLFKQLTGQTVVNYINALRCHEAQRLLLGGSAKIEEAAYGCGYTNLSHFYRMYRRHIGHLPSEDKIKS